MELAAELRGAELAADDRTELAADELSGAEDSMTDSTDDSSDDSSIEEASWLLISVIEAGSSP